VAWLVGAAGAAGITEAQRRAAQLPIGRLLGSSLGHGLWLRGAPLALAGVLLLLAPRAPRRPQPALLWIAGAATVLAMLGDADTGHAAASPRWEWFRVGTQWVHFASVGIWIGGLAGLLLVLGALAPEERRVAARRYSTSAAVALVTVVLSGGLRAFDEIGSWHQLFHTGFGQLVLIKVGLLSGLIALGAVNRFRSVPAAGTRPQLLRRLGGSELAVVAVVLIATAALLNLAPSRSSAAATTPPTRPLVFDAHDPATTVRLHLTVTPGAAGFNQFGLTLVDYDTRAPVDGAVSLRFSLPARADLGDSTLPMSQAGPGTYTARGPNLSIDGTWTVSVLIQRPTGAVEVPVTITPRLAPQDITVQRYVGTPDISTLHLPGNRSVQVYLDPGRTGVVNEFHVTVIGPDNNELATDSVTVSATASDGGPPTNLTVRKLDPVGHFVADLRSATPGRYSFDVRATTAQGESIHGTFTGAVA
jgi:putative copper export protein